MGSGDTCTSDIGEGRGERGVQGKRRGSKGARAENYWVPVRKIPCRGQEAQRHPGKSGQAREAHAGKFHDRLPECEPQESRGEDSRRTEVRLEPKAQI